MCASECVRPDLVPYRDPTPHPVNTCKRRANPKRISSRALSRLTLTASITLRPRQRAPGARRGRLMNLYRQSQTACQTTSSTNGFRCPVVWRAAAELFMEHWRGATLTSFFMHEFVACASVSKPPTPATSVRTLSADFSTPSNLMPASD